DGLVTNAVRESIQPRREQRFGIAQIILVRKDSDMLLVRFVNDGAIDFRFDFGAAAQAIIDPHLDVIRMMRREFADVGAGLFRILRSVTMIRGIRFSGVLEETSAGGVKTGTADFSRSL